MSVNLSSNPHRMNKPLDYQRYITNNNKNTQPVVKIIASSETISILLIFDKLYVTSISTLQTKLEIL